MVALGLGLLIGLERERTKIESDKQAEAPGIRTYAIASVVGAVSVMAGGLVLLAIATVAVAALVAINYWRTLDKAGAGLTTELALLLTVLAGALAMSQPAAAAAAAVVVALLLGSRERLHHFVGKVLTEDEIRSAMVLAAAVVVVLPLLPDEPMGPYGALNPRSVWRLVTLVLMIGAAGHVATRVLGPRFGLPISGLASGFVSSSATIGAMGIRAKKAPEVMGAAVAGAVLSTVATVVQMAVVLAATSPATLNAMIGPLAAAGIAAAGYGAIFTIRALRQPPEEEQSHSKAFSLVAALIFAGTLAAVMLGSAALRDAFGEAGAIAGAALAGFADTHASAISIASLEASGKLSAEHAVVPILAGFTTNTITKVVVAITAGGRAFALRVVPGILLVAAAAWAGMLVHLPL